MKSFKIILLVTTVFLSSIELKAQVDSLYVSSNFIGAYKVVSVNNGEEIKGPRAISKLMNQDSEAFIYMKKSANSLNASRIIFLTGLAAGLGFYAYRINNPEIGGISFFTGIAVLSVSTALYFLSKKQARKSVAIFNGEYLSQQPQSSLQFKVHPTGLGLALNF